MKTDAAFVMSDGRVHEAQVELRPMDVSPQAVRERAEIADRAAQTADGSQQLVARIKRTSKYAYQAPASGWFDVSVVHDMGYGLRGNNNQYRFGDVVFGIRLADGSVAELRTK